jgi:O-6-methylguanine DNA methyltransferase
MDLTALRSPAPPGLADRVLALTGPADEWAVVDGPAGELSVAWSAHGISLVLPGSDAEALADALRRRLDRGARRAAAPPAGLVPALRSGRSTGVAVDLRTRSPFERDVLAAARRIPPGEVRTYGWVAAAVGRPGAVRAVGTALGRNPVPVLVPCHRVVPAGGGSGSYALGPDYKQRLLEHEGVDDAALRPGLVGSATTHVFCVPSCRDARRITDRHRVAFRTAAQAGAAGYRPCRHCDPVPSA